MYNWYEPMVHYFTELSYTLCTFLGGKWQILFRLFHGWWRKRTLTGTAYSSRTFMEAAYPRRQ